MVAEVLEHLSPKPGQTFMDGTLGGGGHTHALLDATSPDGTIISLDRDPEAIAQARQRLTAYGERFIPVLTNYAEAAQIAQEHRPGGVDGLLIDAGVSSHQLDDPGRGFSFQNAGPLDMRMGPDSPSLADLLSQIEHPQLTHILRHYGEVQNPSPLAKAIIEDMRAGKLTTTADLSDLILRIVGRPRQKGPKKPIHPATLVFQGLRIATNDELTHLERVVDTLPQIIKPGGIAVFISFHSLEDRIVKQGLKRLENPCTCPPSLPLCACHAKPKVQILTSKPIRPSDREVELNPRSRSALLRAARICG